MRKYCWTGSIKMGLGLLGLALSLTAAAGDSRPAKDPGEVFRKLDEDRDGKLNRKEFLKLAERAKDRKMAEARLGKIYDRLDPRGEGLTQERFRKILAGPAKKMP